MSEDRNIIDLIEKDILSFSEFSRFPDAGIMNMLPGQRVNPGIRISTEVGEMTVNCDIIVYFGVNIPQLCYDIQSKVKTDIERMTGVPVKAVNIRVEGIDKAKSPS